MQDNCSFLVWACRAGVITVKSGPFLIQLSGAQARELAHVLHDAADAITPKREAETLAKNYDLVSALRKASRLIKEPLSEKVDDKKHQERLSVL
jgi:hypothetical protein